MLNNTVRFYLLLVTGVLQCGFAASAQGTMPAETAPDQTSVIDGLGMVQPAGGPLPSTRNWPGAALEVLRFRLVDAGSGDKLPTILSRLVIRRATGCTADLNLVFAGAALWDGATELPLAAIRILADRIELDSRVPEVFVADADSAVFALRVYLRSDGVLPDGAACACEVNSTSDAYAAAGASSSFSKTAGFSVRSEIFTIQVTPTQLSYTVIPRTITRNAPFPVSVSATDACGNIARSFGGSITVSLDSGSGVIGTAFPVNVASSGIAAWTDIRYSAVGVFRLAVATAGLGSFRSTSVNSGSNADIAWTSTGAFLYPRFYHTATLLPTGIVLATGGRNGTQAQGSCELFDVKANGGRGAWKEAAPMLSKRERHTATLMPFARIIVAGGLDGVPVKACELYDWQTDQWLAIDSMLDARYEHTATLLRDGRILVAGSKNYDKGFVGCELFDLPMLRGKGYGASASFTGMWRRTGALHIGRGKHTATLLHDGRVLVTGGVSEYVPVASCEIYDPGMETWTDASPMQVAREGHSATLLADGCVLVTGGSSDTETSCEVFDPAVNNGRGSWLQLASMNRGRRLHAAALMQDGMLLVTGSWIIGQGARSCEIFETSNPGSSAWTTVSSMLSQRASHTLTPLPDGRVLAAGGEVYGNQQATPDCEIGALQYITAAGEAARPDEFILDAAYPNPFAATTVLQLHWGSAGPVSIAMWSSLGRRVRILYEGRMAPGTRVIEWDGRDDAGRRLAPGNYFVRATGARGELRQRAVLLLH